MKHYITALTILFFFISLGGEKDHRSWRKKGNQSQIKVKHVFKSIKIKWSWKYRYRERVPGFTSGIHEKCLILWGQSWKEKKIDCVEIRFHEGGGIRLMFKRATSSVTTIVKEWCNSSIVKFKKTGMRWASKHQTC